MIGGVGRRRSGRCGGEMSVVVVGGRSGVGTGGGGAVAWPTVLPSLASAEWQAHGCDWGMASSRVRQDAERWEADGGRRMADGS